MNKSILTLLLLLSTASSQASLIEITRTRIINQSWMPGVSVGDTVTITLTADNGGEGINSQSWLISDLIGGRLEVGNYWQSYGNNSFNLPNRNEPSDQVFRTNSDGSLTYERFYGTNYEVAHQDSFSPQGTQTVSNINLYNGTFYDYYGRAATFGGYIPYSLNDWRYKSCCYRRARTTNATSLRYNISWTGRDET